MSFLILLLLTTAFGNEVHRTYYMYNGVNYTIDFSLEIKVINISVGPNKQKVSVPVNITSMNEAGTNSQNNTKAKIVNNVNKAKVKEVVKGVYEVEQKDQTTLITEHEYHKKIKKALQIKLVKLENEISSRLEFTGILRRRFTLGNEKYICEYYEQENTHMNIECHHDEEFEVMESNGFKETKMFRDQLPDLRSSDRTIFQ